VSQFQIYGSTDRPVLTPVKFKLRHYPLSFLLDMERECSTLGALSSIAPLPIAVAAVPKEEAAYASTHVTAGVSAPSPPSPSHSTQSPTRARVSTSPTWYIRLRGGRSCGTSPPPIGPAAGSPAFGESSRVGVALVSWKTRPEGQCVRRRASRCSRCGSQVLTPCTSILAHSCISGSRALGAGWRPTS
jgi:hypothetical protein